MSDKIKYRVNILLAGICLVFIFIFALVKPDDEMSFSERRKLRQMPELSIDTVFNKKGSDSFMDSFELYVKDQFPMRETFRSINAYAGRYILGRAEINNLYVSNGYIAKIEDGFHKKDYEWSSSRIGFILDTYVTDNNVYMAIVPDKNFYLGQDKGYPYVDVDELALRYASAFADKLTFINLNEQLTVSDYYRTDTHWKQEEITDVAEHILTVMGKKPASEYMVNELDTPFYGVYYGQAALKVPADTIKYLTYEGMEEAIVTCYDTGVPERMEMYDYEKALEADAYEFFLSGSKSLITIENPSSDGGELVLFRDSFGSSIAPLLVPGYSKITLVDIRYINPGMLSYFIDFRDADILFLYSSAVLNNSVGQFN